MSYNPNDTVKNQAPRPTEQSTGVRHGNGASDLARKTAETAKSIPQAAKQTVAATAHLASEKIREQGGAAKEKLMDRLDAQKENAAAKVGDLGEAIRDAELSLQEKNHARAAEYVGRVADRIESLAYRVETAHPKELYQSVNDFARRRPKLTVAALFMGGFVLGRFLRASQHHEEDWQIDLGRTEDPVGRWLDDGADPLPTDSTRNRTESSFSNQPGTMSRTEDGTFRSSDD